MEANGKYSEADNMTALAAEYRKSAAILAVRLKQLGEKNEYSEQRKQMEDMLRETRKMAAAVAHYYDMPRDRELTSAGWITKKKKEN